MDSIHTFNTHTNTSNIFHPKCKKNFTLGQKYITFLNIRGELRCR